MKQLNKKSKIIVFFSIVIISILLATTLGSMIPLAMDPGDGGDERLPPPPPPDPDPYEIPDPIEPPPAPSLYAFSPSTDPDGSVYVHWTVVSVATGYQVYMSKDGGAYALIKTTASVAHAQSGLTNGVYSFKVRSYNSDGISSFSTIRSVTVAIPSSVILAPTLQPISPTIDDDGFISLRWSSVSGASLYKVYKSRDQGEWQLVVDTTSTSTVVQVSINGGYNFGVKASGATGISKFSNLQSVYVILPDPKPPAPILNPIVPNPDTDGIITLFWSTPLDTSFGISLDTLFIVPYPGGISYDVFVCGVLIGSTTETTYTDEITLDGAYDYKIRAKNSYGVSKFSNIESVIVDIQEGEFVPDSPTLNQLTYTIDGEEVEISLSWSVVDCNSYNVYKSVDGGSYVLIQSNLVLTTYSEVLTDEALYSYKITAENEHGESELSNPTSISLTGDGGVGDYAMIYVLLGVLGVLTGITIITVILVKKKRK